MLSVSNSLPSEGFEKGFLASAGPMTYSLRDFKVAITLLKKYVSIEVKNSITSQEFAYFLDTFTLHRL